MAPGGRARFWAKAGEDLLDWSKVEIIWQQDEQFERRGAFGIALPLRRRRKTLNRNDGPRMSAKIRGNPHWHETAYCRTHSGWHPQSTDICCS
jgi:hypothetical protein